jgi:ATP-dependent DNA helicase 2 subunit 1
LRLTFLGGILTLSQYLEGRRDVILFCIDCSQSMLALYEDPNYEDTQTCHLYTALEAAMQIQKKKIIVGPNDSVGILLFNTVRYYILHGCIT